MKPEPLVINDFYTGLEKELLVGAEQVLIQLAAFALVVNIFR